MTTKAVAYPTVLKVRNEKYVSVTKVPVPMLVGLCSFWRQQGEAVSCFSTFRRRLATLLGGRFPRPWRGAMASWVFYSGYHSGLTVSACLFRLKGPSWSHWARLYDPGWSPLLKAMWWATSVPACHIQSHTHSPGIRAATSFGGP